LNQATPRPDIISRWFTKWPESNIGIATGDRAGIFVVDIDPRNGGFETLAALEQKHGQFPDTLTAKTGGGGLHYYYRIPRGTKISSDANVLGPGVDIKGDGGFVVAPPSLHASGGVYEWDDPDRFVMDPPDWMIRELTRRGTGGSGVHKKAPPLPEVIGEGERDKTLLSHAGKLRRAGMGEDEIYAALVPVNASRCQPPMSDDQVRKIARSAARYEPGTTHGNAPTGRDYHLTDAGNSERFVDQFRGDVLHCAPLKAWYVWSGTVWEIDVTNKVLELATRTAKSLYAEAATGDESSKIAKWAMQTESLQRRRNMIEGAVFHVAVKPEELDARPELFNLLNGTLNLETYEFKPHDPADRLTMIAGVEYVPGLICPEWVAHLKTIFDNDDKMVSSFQELCGYSLLQFNPEQIAIVLWGLGANGKSETLRVLSSVMGSYGINIEAKTLMRSKHEDGDRARPDVVRMKGARFISVTEPGERDELSENLVKSFTGDDVITARPLYAKPIQFQPGGKIFMSTNHKPRIRGTDDGIWRRIWLYPFIVKIEPEKRIRDYGAVLFNGEGSGIFNWMIDGLKRYQARGKLEKPAKVEQAVTEYRIENNPLGAFINDRCVCEKNAEYEKQIFYMDWQNYCVGRAWNPGSMKRVSQNMLSLFEERQDRETGKRFWVGIGIKNTEDTPEEHRDGEIDTPPNNPVTGCNTFLPNFSYETNTKKLGKTLLHPVTENKTTITRAQYLSWLVSHELNTMVEPGKYARKTDKKPAGWCGCRYGGKPCSDLKNPTYFSDDPLLQPMCDRCFNEMKRMYESIGEVQP
jgi:putative DNA primase/helicase